MTARDIKTALIDCKKGIPTKITFHNNRSFKRATTNYMVFGDLRLYEFNAAVIKHRLKEILKKNKITVHDTNDWILNIRIKEWDEFHGMEIGPTRYELLQCDNYEIWNHIKLRDIEHELITLLYECNETSSKIRS